MTATDSTSRPFAADHSSTEGNGDRRKVDGPSLGDLVSSASRDLSTLVRSELALAKLELKADAKAAIGGAVMFAIAAVFGLFIMFVLLVAFAEGLVAVGIWRWAAYLIVAGVLVVLAAITGLVGLRMVKKIKAPERTIQTTKETIAWARKPTQTPSSMPAAVGPTGRAQGSTASVATVLPAGPVDSRGGRHRG